MGKKQEIPHTRSGLTRESLADMYSKMLLIREFEEKVEYFITRGKIHGTAHLYVGQEATAVGACAALSDADLMTSTHRGHGHSIAKGADINMMMAELFGKANGYCRGKGGSMHIADVSTGNLGANGIVGGGVAIAAGAALTSKMRNEEHVVICFFGDGALNQGVFHEAINMAAVWDLPVIYLCENNQYAMSLSTKKAFKVSNLADRAVAYGIPGKNMDGNDVIEVYETVSWARDYVKQNGPVLLISDTYRHKGHSKSDANRYRTKDEVAQWKRLDPIPRMRSRLEKDKSFTAEELDRIERRASETVNGAVEFAQNSPDPSTDSILDDVYA